MKCCICGCEIPEHEYGNNPYPICNKNDEHSRCCDICNDLVIKARIINMKSKYKLQNTNIGDTLVIFHTENSDIPTIFLVEYGKFLSGEITSIEQKSNHYIAHGTWGNYIISDEDSYSII